MRAENDEHISDAKCDNLRILSIIPGDPNGGQMPFARRQSAVFIDRFNAHVRSYFLQNRTSLSGLWRAGREVKKLLKEERSEVVHVHYGTITALFAVLVSKVPVVITFHGSDLNPTPTDGRLRDVFGRLCSQLAALRAAGIVCVSDGLVQRLWWRRHKAHVFPMGVDLQLFKPMDKKECRDLLGWDLEEQIVLFNANNPRLKRSDIAERTIGILVKRGLPVRLEMLKGGISPAQMPIMMNAADALLLCSDQEGSPTMVKEAMACGLPVVSNDVGDVRLRTDGVSPGAIVDQDADRMADALAPILAAGHRSNGRELAKRNGIDSEHWDKATFDLLCTIARWK